MSYYAYAAILAALLLGFTVGYVVRLFLSKPVEIAQLSTLMTRIVHNEEAEVQRNQTRRMLHDAKRRTMRVGDSGPPAKVTRMRVRSRRPRTPK